MTDTEKYSENKLYEHIKEHTKDKFLFYYNEISLMFVVSGENNFRTTKYSCDKIKYILLDDRSIGCNIPDEYKQSCISVAETFAKKLSIPIIHVEYRNDILTFDENSYVNIRLYNAKNNTTEMDKTTWDTYENYLIFQLDKLLNKYNIECSVIENINNEIKNDGGDTKPINSKPSSAFHIWQRDCLDMKGFIVDIDLIRYRLVNGKKTMAGFYELKRSHTDFDSWIPYVNDRFNYLAYAKLSELLNLKFETIFYGQDYLSGSKKSNNLKYKDNISRIKIFDIYHKVGTDYSSHNLLIRLKTIEPLEKFLDDVQTTSFKDSVVNPDYRSM